MLVVLDSGLPHHALLCFTNKQFSLLPECKGVVCSCRLWFLLAQWPGPINMTKSPPRTPSGTSKDMISGRFSLDFVQASKGSLRPNQRGAQDLVWDDVRAVCGGASLGLFCSRLIWLQVIGKFWHTPTRHCHGGLESFDGQDVSVCDLQCVLWSLKYFCVPLSLVMFCRDWSEAKLLILMICYRLFVSCASCSSMLVICKAYLL